MTPEQVLDLKRLRCGRALKGRDLQDQRDRTLLHGYTWDRLSYHVYLQDGVIHQLIYTTLRATHSQAAINHVVVSHRTQDSEYFMGDVSMWLPSKRVYPERCDFQFCALLTLAGAEIPFTAFGACAPNAFIPTHREAAPHATASLAEAFLRVGIEPPGEQYRICVDLADELCQRLIGRYHFADTPAEPQHWIILERDIPALAKEIAEFTRQALALDMA